MSEKAAADAPTVEDDDCEYIEGEEGVETMPANAAMVAVLEAAETGDVGTLTELLEGVSIDMRGEDGDTALHIGCLHGQLGVVEECLKRGADVNVSDEDGSTPLHDAAAGGYVEIVGLLTEDLTLRLEAEKEVTLEIASEALEWIAKEGYDAVYGAGSSKV